jgi:hypothetical protein
VLSKMNGKGATESPSFMINGAFKPEEELKQSIGPHLSMQKVPKTYINLIRRKEKVPIFGEAPKDTTDWVLF